MVRRTWTMSQLTEPLVSSSEVLLQKRYYQAKDRENQLFALLSANGPLDPNVQHLNNNIRDCYEGILLADHAFAEYHEVEQAIWNLHYKQIEDFRHRINRMNSTAQGTGAQVSSTTAFSRGRRKNLLQREPVIAIFKSFLAEASGFYHKLISKLRAKYGLPFDISERPPISANDYGQSVELRRCQRSCHRCLIYLGDFARYKEYYVGSNPRNFNFSIAVDFYQKAVSFLPSIGQPYNQMAVLAVYMGDDLLAVYHYFRSLAAEKPFPTARENLTMLFESNRLKYCQLHADVCTKEPCTKEPMTKLEYSRVAELEAVGDGAPKTAKRNAVQEASHEPENSFLVRFVRLNGILFTKTSLEIFKNVCAAAICDLEKLLALGDKEVEERLGSGHGICLGMRNCGASGSLQLVTILICSVENINWGSKGNQLTYTDSLQRAVLFQHAITASLEIVGLLVCRCAETEDVFGCPLLPAILIFIEWLACRPEVILQVGADGMLSDAWPLFWKRCIILLNQFCDHSILNCDLVDNLETLVGISSLEDCKMGTSLWEDRELQGFFPLAPAHIALDYSQRQSDYGVGTKKEVLIRLQRFLAAGKALVNALDGSGIGILFDENEGKFFCVGEGQQKGSDLQQFDDSLKTNVHRSKDGSWRNMAKGCKEMAVTPSKQALGDDEDEELIVFKPSLNSPPSSLCSTALMEPPVVNSLGVKLANVLVSPICTMQDTLPLIDGSGYLLRRSNPAACSVLNSAKENLEMLMACPLSKHSYSVKGSDMLSFSNLSKDADLTAVTSLPCSPGRITLPPQDQLSQTEMPCTGSKGVIAPSTIGNVGMLPDFLKKPSNNAGVIGQPRQLHNVIFKTIDTCSAHGLADCKMTTHGLNEIREHHPPVTLPVREKSFSIMQSMGSSDNPTEVIQTNLYAGPKVWQSAAGLSSLSESLSPATVLSAPPGFAPQSMKFSGSLELRDGAQGQMNNQKAFNDQQEFDDYCWLDDYKPSNLGPKFEDKKPVPSSNGADYSLWSSGMSNWVKRDTEVPLLTSSQFHIKQEQKQNSAMLLKQQPDKESWSLFGAAVQCYWNSAISS